MDVSILSRVDFIDQKYLELLFLGHQRPRFSPYQRSQLEKSFNDNAHPDGNIVKCLAQKINLTDHQVIVWFNNRKTRASKEQHLQKQNLNRNDGCKNRKRQKRTGKHIGT